MRTRSLPFSRHGSGGFHQTLSRASSGPVLTVRDLGVDAGGRNILRGVSFDLEEHSSLAIIGPNGSGKTLLLKALLGLLPFSGHAAWRAGMRLGYVPQKIYADPQLPLRVRELLVAKAKVQHLSPELIDNAIAWTAIQDLIDRRLGSLSSGQLQRVLIAFALAGAPDALLVDEPTSSLDELAEERLYELLTRTRDERGTTLLLVSHDLTLVRGIATHVLCVSGGTAAFGAAEEMLSPQVLERMYGQPLEFHSHRLEKRP
ncbi:MAG TPA: ATP-binding cassette domain-containing protein [Candidatus Limnocylindrales bacterium]|nr:ATP-binding cassette domain-containing protein [Candidatus Limnocylindrales bacterium]